jgi:hypothetical protein
MALIALWFRWGIFCPFMMQQNLNQREGEE